MVVGAGRGPLVKAAMQASFDTQRKVKLYAIEKNLNAINTYIIVSVCFIFFNLFQYFAILNFFVYPFCYFQVCST